MFLIFSYSKRTLCVSMFAVFRWKKFAPTFISISVLDVIINTRTWTLSLSALCGMTIYWDFHVKDCTSTIEPNKMQCYLLSSFNPGLITGYWVHLPFYVFVLINWILGSMELLIRRPIRCQLQQRHRWHVRGSRIWNQRFQRLHEILDCHVTHIFHSSLF